MLGSCDAGKSANRPGGTAAQLSPSPAPRPSTISPGASTPAPVPAPAPVSAAEAGAVLYAKYCALCHGPEAKGYIADNAPSLVSDTFLRSATDQFLASGIARGRPGTPMAPYGAAYGGPLNDVQVQQVVAFLRSKGPAAEPLLAVATGNAAAGKPVFAQHCQKCHGDGPKRSSPRLDLPEFLQAATNSFLDYAIRKGRPGTPMEPFEGKLKQQQIDDVIAYLRTFESPRPASALEAPTGKEPMVINPKGKPAQLKLRDGRFASAADVAAAFKAKRRLVILDARAASDWMLGHIPGAVSMPYYDMRRLEEVPKDGTWVLAYCACPHHASGEVVDELRRRGYPNTAVIDEGITFWRQQGYPMVDPPGGYRPEVKAPAGHDGHDHSSHGH
ncbi:MAG TPA: c-type cytochrome [Kofleriaceae bacterium]|nr:c-type cytochrome [Kofleriaceae bacterium]